MTLKRKAPWPELNAAGTLDAPDGLTIRTNNAAGNLQSVMTIAGNADAPDVEFLAGSEPWTRQNGGGVLMHSPNGTRFRIAVSDLGTTVVHNLG